MNMMKYMNAIPARWIWMRMRWRIFCWNVILPVHITGMGMNIRLCVNRSESRAAEGEGQPEGGFLMFVIQERKRR